MKIFSPHRLPAALLLVFTLLGSAFLLSACRPVVVVEGQPQPTETVITPTRTPAAAPTQTAIPVPSGNEEEPLIMAFVSENSDPAAQDAAAQLTGQLSSQSGLNIQAQSFASYHEVLDGLGKGDIQMAWLPPLTYLQASRMGIAGAALLTNHFGVYMYGTQFFANADDDYTTYFDATTNTDTADAQNALKQFSGKRPCFTDPSSASGFIVPEGLLLKNNVDFLPPVQDQAYTSVLRSLYIKGICDFGATYSVTGDPRTSSEVADLKDVMDKIVIVWQSDPVIPNLNFSFQTAVSPDLRASITKPLLDLAGSEEGLTLISTATNYDVQSLKQIDDTTYDPLRELVDLAKPDPKTVIGK